MPRCRACSGGFFEQQLPAGAQHAGDHGDGLLPLGHVVDDAEVDNGVVAGARLLDVADVAEPKATQRAGAGVCARARPWSRRGRPPPPVADWYDMQFGIDHVRRYFSGSSRVVQRDDNDHDISVQIDGTQGPKDGDVTRHIMVIDVNTEALELGSAPPAGSSGAHSSPRQTRPIRWPTTTG